MGKFILRRHRFMVYIDGSHRSFCKDETRSRKNLKGIEILPGKEGSGRSGTGCHPRHRSAELF